MWGACLLSSLALPARAVTIYLPDTFVTTGAGSIDIPVTIVSGDAVTDMVLFIQVGNGGTVTGKPPVPMVTSFDFTGSIWEAAPGWVHDIERLPSAG